MKTNLENLNQQIKDTEISDAYGKWYHDELMHKARSAQEYSESFTQESKEICPVSLALILQELEWKIDDLENEIRDLKRQ